jgi:hypothetical protein
MIGSEIEVFWRGLQRPILLDRRRLTFMSTYFRVSRQPFLTCSSNNVEPLFSRTLRASCSHMKLNRGSDVTPCPGITAPMDHSFKGRSTTRSFLVDFPFEGAGPEMKPDGFVACGSRRLMDNSSQTTQLWGHQDWAIPNTPVLASCRSSYSASSGDLKVDQGLLYQTWTL